MKTFLFTALLFVLLPFSFFPAECYGNSECYSQADTLIINVPYPKSDSGAIISPVMLDLSRFRFVRFNIVSEEDLSAKEFTLIHSFLRIHPRDTLKANASELILPVKRKRYTDSYDCWLYVKEGDKELNFATITFNGIAPVVMIDSTSYLVSDGVLDIRFKAVIWHQHGMVPDIDALEAAMTDVNGKETLQISHARREWDNRMGDCLAFNFHFRLNALEQPLVFKIDPGEKLYLKGMQFTWCFFNGFIRDFALHKIMSKRFEEKSIVQSNSALTFKWFRDAIMSDNNTIWVLSSDKVFRSTDRGKSWQKISLNDESGLPLINTDGCPDVKFSGIYFNDSNNGWIAGYLNLKPGAVENAIYPQDQYLGKHGLFKTTNAGKSWKWLPIEYDELRPGSQYIFPEISKESFSDKNHGWFLYHSSYSRDWDNSSTWVFGRTKDGGESWKTNSETYSHSIRLGRFRSSEKQERSLQKAMELYCFTDSLQGKALFNYYNYYSDYQKDSTLLCYSKDGGENWINSRHLSRDAFGYPFRILFSDENNGWLFSCKHRRESPGLNDLLFFRTSDAGMNWKEVSLISQIDTSLKHEIKTVSNFDKDGVYIYYKKTDQNGGYSTCLLKSARGGQNWKTIEIPSKYEDYTLRLLKNKTALLFKGSNVLVSYDGAESWKKVLSSLTDKDLYSVASSDSLSAVAVGEDGIILETRDGRDWKVNTPAGGSSLFDITCTRGGKYFASGASGTLLFREGSKGKFKTLSLGTKKDLRKVRFTDELTGFTFSDEALYRTADGGGSWEKISNFGLEKYNYRLVDFYTSDGNILFLLWTPNKPERFAGYNYMIKSTDMGRSWEKIWHKDSDLPESEFQPLYYIKSQSYSIYPDFIADQNGNGYGISGGYFYSITNGGTRWIKNISVINSAREIADLFTLRDGSILLLGADGTLGLSENMENWAYFRFPSYRGTLAMNFFNNREGWIVGENGLILKVNIDRKTAEVTAKMKPY